MQVVDSDLLAYLRHRVGEARISSRRPLIERKALELNQPQPDFSKTFGQPDITAYVGFIDLAGFSNATNGKSPGEIADYVRPFLEESIRILRGRRALIDKTIGDEIMFVLPETEEDPKSPEVLLVGQICGDFYDLAHEGDRPYRYRIGLSYGKVRAVKIDGEGFSEWTFFGEPIHVAKRLQALQRLANPNPVCGAFGMVVPPGQLESVLPTLRARLGIIAGFASRFRHELVAEPVALKGVGEVCYALLLSRQEAAA